MPGINPAAVHATSFLSSALELPLIAKAPLKNVIRLIITEVNAIGNKPNIVTAPIIIMPRPKPVTVCTYVPKAKMMASSASNIKSKMIFQKIQG